AIPIGAGWEPLDADNVFTKLAPVAVALRNKKAVKPLVGNLGDNKKPGIIHTIWVQLMTGYFNDPDALAAVIEGSDKLSVSEDEVMNIKIPVYCITGTDDPFYSSAVLLSEKAPNTKLFSIEKEDHITTINSKHTHEALMNCLRTWTTPQTSHVVFRADNF